TAPHENVIQTRSPSTPRRGLSGSWVTGSLLEARPRSRASAAASRRVSPPSVHVRRCSPRLLAPSTREGRGTTRCLYESQRLSWQRELRSQRPLNRRRSPAPLHRTQLADSS